MVLRIQRLISVFMNIVHRPCMKHKRRKSLIIRINQRVRGFCVPDLSTRIPLKAKFYRK